MATDTDYTGGANLEAMREARHYNRYLADLVERFAEDKSRVLDFGAGVGTFSEAVRARGATVTCLEPDNGQRQLLARQGFPVLHSLDVVPSNSFSYVYTLNVLEHIEDDGASLAELYRVLAPGGRLFIYVPAFQSLYSAMDRKVGHFRRYRRKPAMRLASGAGFVVERCGYTDVLGFFATLMYKALPQDRSGRIDARSVRVFDRFLFPVSRTVSPLFSRLFGKNLFLVARKKAG